ncbi:MAG: serine/threonine-protein kinase [Pseudomonadota bacterium]
MAGADGLDFSTLDKLLDQALECDEEQLATLLEGLPEAQRSALVRLLGATDSNVLEKISKAARSSPAVKAAGPIPSQEKSRRAGSWRLCREIGHGGTAQVFFAERVDESHDKRTNFKQRAAVKILWSHRIGSQFSDRFFRERRILASIDHPGLARFLDGGLLGDNRPWFAMEYIAGEDIVTACRGRPIEDRLRLLCDVCQTIDYAHRRLIVHRDIKPGNVLVDSTGRPRVLDFGIARILDDAEESALTHADGVPLTLRYASPEQVAGRTVDVASDIYQLGVLAYEMLTGFPPYEISESSLQESVRVITEKVPPAASAYDSRIQRDVDAIVAQALAKDPSDRYPSAAAFAEDIRLFLDDRPVAARPRTIMYVARRFVRRRALTISIVAASVLGLTAATVFSLDRAREAKEAAARSRTTLEILADVFEQADPFGDAGAEVTLAEALIRARPAIAEKTAHAPKLAIEVNQTLADIFLSLDMLDYEVEAHEAAWAAAAQLGSGFERQLIASIAAIGNTKTRLDPREAALFLQKHLPESPPTKDAARDWLSGKYAEAHAWLRLRDDHRTDAIAGRMHEVAVKYEVDDPRTLGRISQLLAGTARRANNLPAADRHWQEAVEYMSQAGQPAGHAVILSNQALHYGSTERYKKSEEAFRKSIAVFREHDPENTTFADILRLYAGLQFRMGDPAAALGTLSESLAILDRERDHYSYFVAQNKVAEYAFASGAFDAAFDAIDDGLDLAFEAFGSEDEVTARMIRLLARLLAFAGAEESSVRALGMHDVLCEQATVRANAIYSVLSRNKSTDDQWRQTSEALTRARTDVALDRRAFDALIDRYRSINGTVLDPLDRLTLIEDLHQLALRHAYELPAELASARLRLLGQRAGTAEKVAGRWNARISYLLDSLDSHGAGQTCAGS